MRGAQEPARRDINLDSVGTIDSGYLGAKFSWSDNESGSSWSISDATPTTELTARVRFIVGSVTIIKCNLIFSGCSDRFMTI